MAYFMQMIDCNYGSKAVICLRMPNLQLLHVQMRTHLTLLVKFQAIHKKHLRNLKVTSFP